MATIKQFLQETKSELKQVHWTKRRRLILYTVIVIVFSLGLGYVLGAFDSLFQFALRSIIVK